MNQSKGKGTTSERKLKRNKNTECIGWVEGNYVRVPSKSPEILWLGLRNGNYK